MSDLLAATLKHLAALVSFDTRNPPRAIAGEDSIFGYLRAQLPDFNIEVTDHGAGAVSFFAVRGTPKFLFNVHLDTVPDSPHWSTDPHVLRVTDDRAIGLGACDIKGAAAGLVAAANVTNGDAAFLFTTDEEANDPRCIAAFLRRDHGFRDVVVAEPTKGEAVLAHRGISAVQMTFHGIAGHASGVQSKNSSALHQMIRWGSRALDFVQSHDGEEFGGLKGLRFNIGRVDGGIKANVIAPRADVRFGFRPLPSQDMAALHAQFRAFAGEGVDYEEIFHGESLPAGAANEAETRRRDAQAFAESLQLPIGPAVDFWTEAALFSQAGFNAVVYGPGDIAQAHSADEWVSLQQLSDVTSRYRQLMEQ